MSASAADVVIVGGGVHGASLAYHLARKKAGRVVLVEKKFIASGPSGRSTALVRRFYAMDFFTRTASAAAEIFRHWKDVIGGDGDPGFQQAGRLVLAGADAAPHLRHNAMRAQELGAKVALLDPPEVRTLVPSLGIDDVALASYEAESGYADPSSTANALVNRARELGAVIVLVSSVQTAPEPSEHEAGRTCHRGRPGGTGGWGKRAAEWDPSSCAQPAGLRFRRVGDGAGTLPHPR